MVSLEKPSAGIVTVPSAIHSPIVTGQGRSSSSSPNEGQSCRPSFQGYQKQQNGHMLVIKIRMYTMYKAYGLKGILQADPHLQKLEFCTSNLSIELKNT